jgi:uncharacterized protein (TIGR00369 family)
MTSEELATILAQLASAPPHSRALGMSFESAVGDTLTLAVPYREDLIGDPETKVLAGGVVTALLDHTCGLSVWLKLAKFAQIATVDLRIDYMRAATPGLTLKAAARCHKLTRSIAFVRGWAYDADIDDPVAAAQATFMFTSEGQENLGINLDSALAGAPVR